ncbi:MAG: hypothetical protein ABMA00_13535 [Gemmatimonas sp.]
MPDPELIERAVAAERARQRRSSALGFVFAVLLLSPVGYVLATLLEMEGTRRLVMAPSIVAGLLLTGLTVVKLVQWISGQLVVSIMSPGGRSRGPAGHSKAEALVAAGRLEDATAEFESTRAKSGDTVASLRAEAELHAMSSGDPKRAESLFQRIRRAPDARPGDELYASHRLIDLYLGPLGDPGRVMVELRRMAERFPETLDGQSALAELKRRREESGS